ncbi:MAG: segregation/condensation protein A [Clostridia bacterium]|nr:segregation/condensation protein A [Clostridia bacterium]
MKNNILSSESNKYAVKLSNFEGPLDLLVFLIDKDKVDIYDISIDKIADQYMEYLNEQERLNLEIASEFLVMASTLLLIKSKGLLPKQVEDEAEITEEELIRRIIEYKKYKEICKTLKLKFEEYSKRIFKFPETIELPKQNLEITYTENDIVRAYKKLLQKNTDKKNEYASNIKKIAVSDEYSVADKVKEIYKELIIKPKFVFGNRFSLKEKPKAEVVTAFTGVLELSRRSKILTNQEELFGDIVISKRKRGANIDEVIL